MELLMQLYKIHSMSGEEKKMKRFIKRTIQSIATDATIDYDAMGNMYITKGSSESYPCVVAHLDQVQRSHAKDFEAYYVPEADVIFGYSKNQRTRQGLGADDKNGIWIALKCLERYDNIKLAFFVQEEVGCVGSEKANMRFFDDCRFVIQCDRKGAYDLITDVMGTEMCSVDFIEASEAEAFGYKPESGMLTDVYTLKENGLKVSCINMSCGYHEPHTDNEFTVWSELTNCLNLVMNIIEKCTEVYPHEYVDQYSYGGYYRGGAWYDDYDRYYFGGHSVLRDFRDPVKVVRVSDYADIDCALDDFLFNNLDYECYELWPYISADCATYGVTHKDFFERFEEIHSWMDDLPEDEDVRVDSSTFDISGQQDAVLF